MVILSGPRGKKSDPSHIDRSFASAWLHLLQMTHERGRATVDERGKVFYNRYSQPGVHGGTV
jgi:hypothetical protein